MAEPSLENIFGAGATQSASTLTISKTDLASAGLTAATENTSESLLAAILFLAKESLTAENFANNADQSITIEPGFNSIVQRPDSSGNTSEFRQFQYNINLHKPDNAVLIPDDL